MVRLHKLEDLGSKFVLVRLLKIAGADLRLFEFDYDLTWVGFFLDAEERILGRYGGRDASGPDSRLSLAGLRHAMQAALEAHKQERKNPPLKREGKPLRAEDYPAARKMTRGECIHCHQVWEFQRAQRQTEKRFTREDLWVYPLPENIGLTLEVDRGDRVRAVRAGSVADKAGLKAGDILRQVGETTIASQADVQYALHRAPSTGTLAVVYRRDDKEHRTTLSLPPKWKQTNYTWRPSLLDILPSLTLYGEDLTKAEKTKLGLPAQRLAFRQEETVHAQAKKAGVRGGDIILGLDGQDLDMTMTEFLGYVRRNYLVGDRIPLLVLRDGKKIRLEMTLR